MIYTPISRKQHSAPRLAACLALLAGVFLLITLSLPAPAGGTAVPHNVHPALLSLAAEQPESTVRVIVQRAGAAEGLEAAVADLDGIVLKDLSIINALVAELPAGSVVDLALSKGVRWVSLDGPVQSSAKGGSGGGSEPFECGYDTANKTMAASNCFPGTLNLQAVWDMGLDGSGIGVAVIDSGLTIDSDFSDIGARLSFSSNSNTVNDVYGHGAHVAGIIAGNGTDSAGAYMGIAPGAKLISLKISDGTGVAYESDTVEAMEWILNNKDTHNIRVVNMSINATLEQSYHTSPMDAAAEILWFNGIVVVASSGNKGASGNYNTANAAPANDPFIITVGGTHEHNTSDFSDDDLAAFTAWGTTMDGHFKPDIMAPGQDIASVLAKSSEWDILYPDRVVGNGEYFRISGTSMASPMVAGAAALILQNEPGLNPDQVKYRLLHSTSRSIDWVKGRGKDAITYSVPYLDIYAAVTAGTTEMANTGIEVSQLLSTGSDPVNWSSGNFWAGVNWASVNWASVNWASVNWASVNWASVSWEE